MRVTELRYAQHIGRAFKVRWIVDGRSKVPDTGAASILASKGIEVIKPDAILSPPYPRNNVELEPWPVSDRDVAPEVLDPCYVVGAIYSPPGGIPQIQHMTNTIVCPSLPQPMLDQVTDNTDEEIERVKEAIIRAHCMDSYQEKLPRFFEITRPGWNYPLEYGTPVRRKNKSLSYQLILLLDQLFPEATTRHLSENVKFQVMLKHSDKLMQFQHHAAFVLSSRTPVASPFSKGERDINSDLMPIPDIHPLSPFLHVKRLTNYSQEEFYGVSSSKAFYPHTVFIHNNRPKLRSSDEQFSAITLIKAFSLAVAYAKLCKKTGDGDLERPIVLQIVHNNRNKYHLGVFQLNTLDMTGSTKNIFWSHPVEMLYDTCSFKGAEATLEGYNPKIFSLLKAFHLQ